MTGRIFLKLALVTILPLLITAVAVLLVVTRIIIADLESGLETSLSEKARLVETTLEGLDRPEYQSMVHGVADRAQARVTVIDDTGRVLADSEASPAEMENHATRPEFAASLNGDAAVSRRYSSTVGVDFLYVALPMDGGGAVRLALPLEEVEALAKANRNSIALVILMIVAPLLLATAWVARRISSQLSGIVSLSNAIADGIFEIDESSAQRGGFGELNELAASLRTTAAKLRTNFHELQEERARFVAAVNGIGEGILVTDRRCRIVLHNPAIKMMFPKEDLEMHTALSSWQNKDIPAIFKHAIKHGRSSTTDLTVDSPTHTSWRVSCAPIMSRKGKIQAVAAVFHDVTELERVDQMRRDFVINVSHELRTPLAAITGYAETLMDGALHDEQNNERFVKILWQNAQRLTRLTSDLMTLSQIEVKTREFEFTQQSVAALLHAAADGIRPVLARKSLQLSVIAPDEDSTIRCDIGAVQQILSNLLDNAAKYTPEGGSITLGVNSKPEALHFFVRDTGIGIPSEHVPRLFERFYRVDKARSRELGGTGLGLAIVKHLVQAHGGAVWVESEPGQGSAFWFSLPFERAPTALEAALAGSEQLSLPVQ